MSAKDILSQWAAEQKIINIEVKGLRETQKYLELIMRDLKGDKLYQTMARAVTMLERDAKKVAPVYTGRLRASITPRIRTIPRSEGVSLIGSVGTNVAYAPTMEFGGPLTSSFDQIMRWVHYKRIAGVYSVKTRRRLGSAERQIAEDRAVAARIYRAMERNGVRAHAFLLPALEKNAGALWRLFGDFVAEVISR